MIRQMKNIPCILVVSRGQGFMSVEGVKRAENFGSSINRTPLFWGDSRITGSYCAF